MQKYKFTILLVLISVYLVFPTESKSCVWIENSNNYRIAMFRAEIPGMSQYRPFYYSADILNSYLPDPALLDTELNCREWQKQLGKDVLINDIQVILYKTKADLFITLYENNTLKSFFTGNTFIETLYEPKNSNILAYLVFAKHNELYNYLTADPWGNIDEGDLIESERLEQYIIFEGQKMAKNAPNDFLKKRYAYHLVRMFHRIGDYSTCVETYKQYFDTNNLNSLIGYWALQHRALSEGLMGNTVLANYLYSIVFSNCASKKIRCYRAFNASSLMMEATLNLAKTPEDKANIYAMSTFKYPGKALDKISDVYTNNPASVHLPVLIMREINKLEDWIFTPRLTEYSPSHYHSSYTTIYEDNYNEARQKNYETDMEYLREFKAWLSTIFNSPSTNFKNYLAIALAHLNLLDSDVEAANYYMAQINGNVADAVILQQSIDELLMLIYTAELEQPDVKNKIALRLTYLEALAQKHLNINKTLYSITAQLSEAYKSNENIAIAGLLKMKSENYKALSVNEYSYDYFRRSYYWKIAYFDVHASPPDIDVLIEIIENEDKTPFQKYLTNQTLNTVNAYLDLKGTIAFRNNNLELAYETFRQLPDDFWQNTYSFSDYLNENPFIPKGHSKRSFNYEFNKTEFVAKLIDLKEEAAEKPEKEVENLIELGDALYNCTYWGNSWMMSHYGWSSYISKYSLMNMYSYFFGSMLDTTGGIWNNYYECQTARKYYQQAYKKAQNEEQQAYSCFMLYTCDKRKFEANESLKNWDAPDGVFSSEYIRPLYSEFYNTNTLRQFNCATLDYYVEKKGYK